MQKIISYLKQHKLAVTIVLILMILGVYSYSSKNKVEYQSYQVESGPVEEVLELSGKVASDGIATLRFPVGGLVTYLGAQEGDTVKKWQTLATVDSRQLKITLEQKLNLYKSQLNTFDDTKDSYENQIEANDIDDTLRRILERNQYSLENSVKDVEYLDLSIKLTRLSSPLSGILVRAPIKTSGVNVIATDTWIVVDPSTLYFSADLDETDLRRVQLGQDVRIRLDAFPDLVIESQVKNIAFVPKETSSGTVYELKLKIDPSHLSGLRLGLNGTAELIINDKSDVMLLPSAAVTFEGSQASVFIKEGDKYVKKEIEIGIETDGVIEVTNGLTKGQDVYVQKN